MITRFRVQNYKALRDVTLELTPIHVLIGPNDSGKTSILEAIGALCRSVDRPLAEAFQGLWTGQDLVWQKKRGLSVSLAAEFATTTGRAQYELSCEFPTTARDVRIHNETLLVDSRPVSFSSKGWSQTAVFGREFQNAGMPQDQSEAVPIVLNALRGVHFYNWNPRLLALPVAPDINRRFRMENDGFGLALRLDDILGYDRSRFARLEDRFRRMFNNIRSVKLIPEQAYSAPVNRVEQITMLSRSAGKGLYFEIDGGTLVSAAQISDGILLVLAYLAVLNLPGPPRMLLIEEPERGVHPKRLQEVVEIVRELVPEQTPTQVVFSTHSPYVVDLFEPKEVSLCRRLEDGSIAVARLSDRPTVREQLKVFTLGEIWTGEGDEAIAKSASASGAATR